MCSLQGSRWSYNQPLQPQNQGFLFSSTLLYLLSVMENIFFFYGSFTQVPNALEEQASEVSGYHPQLL